MAERILATNLAEPPFRIVSSAPPDLPAERMTDEVAHESSDEVSDELSDEVIELPAARLGAAPPADPLSVVSFRQLYLDAYVPMVRLAFLVVGDAAVAEELVQDSFVRVHAKWRTIANPGGYLRTVVLNACRNELRRRRVARKVAARQQADVASVTPTVDPADVELLDALRALTSRQRAVIVLRFYEGLSEAQIAEALDMRPGTVKSTLSRALARLREVIEP